MSRFLIRSSEASMAVAHALADAVDGEVRVVPADTTVEEFLKDLADSEVTAGVVALDGAGWRIVRHAEKPVVLVPAARPIEAIERVLVPLDGTDEAVAAVAETVRLFRSAGVDIVVLHVFDAATRPGFWDQAAHARPIWEQEFLARFCAPHLPGSAPTLTLRTGAPGEHVVDIAGAHADLIILGWSRRLDPGRAQTVRRTVRESPVPVMLIPVAVPG
ncbi:universal stress protein [Nocardia sp. NPDC051570]|uniref:universal stress protein n=1 Tax=Nocardia sp. NPDC051570 TaxID=3364324 RepID=UPI00378CFA38